MAVAYFQFHFPAGFWPLVNHGELAALYCFLWLYFSAARSGALEPGRDQAKTQGGADTNLKHTGWSLFVRQ